MNILDTIKGMIANRGAQWGGRIVLSIILFVAGKLGARLADDVQADIILYGGTIFVAVAYWILDNISHKTQQQDVIGRAVDMVVQRAADSTPTQNAGSRALDKVSLGTVVNAAQSVKSETAFLGKLPTDRAA